MESSVQDGFNVSLSKVLELLRGAPNLEICQLTAVRSTTRARSIGTRVSSAEILLNLTLPALETLYVSQFNIDETAFLHFLTRSAPPIAFLAIMVHALLSLFHDMPTAPELRVRIDELIDAISRQKEALRDLEHQLSSAQGQLNSLLDPMARLPLEITSDIFSQCSWESAMRGLILPSPRLLGGRTSNADIHDTTFVDLLQLWLPRGGDLSFSLSLHQIDSERIHSIFNVLQDHAHRVHNLHIFDIMNIGEMTISFSGLETLTITGSEDRFFCISACLALFRSAPKLVECRLSTVFFKFSEDWLILPGAAIQPCTSSSLQHLHLGGLKGFSSKILLHLTLPSLRTLTVAWLDIDEAEFLRFFTRSSPPLHSLNLTIPWDVYTPLSPTILACLQTVPSLAELRVYANGAAPGWHIFAALATAPELLPNLRSIRVRGNLESVEGYRRVVDFLTSRRPVIQSLYLDVGDTDREFFDGVSSAMREFADEGMSIVVGGHGRNFLLDTN
ncbi:hypothetical protein FB45DRAFT_1036513 [Roridomyces roridus]|uniref:F-box domain-containing protein n=1 Tax=Roridomyces roridus TaxID=1738132 RepID=A0AAD7B8C3_9AGAR|nr:hypothetical protein FB45DRAFT_1036513 [Roridomyces roridus]